MGPGDEVITPSLTWVSTANVIHPARRHPGVRRRRPRHPDVFGAGSGSRHRPATRAIVPVHYAGSAPWISKACARSPGATASPWSRTPPTRSAANTAGAR
ncbi:DegT/DnrJ/EryC1/StrS family aminotransferase [Pseudomonas aeruginosa]